MKTLVVRMARSRDVQAAFALIRELAIHEGHIAEFSMTPKQLTAALFKGAKRASCAVAEIGGQAIGLALWFPAFSSRRGRWLIFVEDLIVHPDYRGRGIGKKLLAYVARRAVRQRIPAVVWEARNSNRKAVSFYRSLWATQHSGSSQFVLDSDALDKLAGENS